MLAEHEGARLFYTVAGQGPACLMPASSGTAIHERLTADLNPSLELVHVDLRGSGRSTGEFATLDFELVADDLDAVRAALGLERVAVLGYSIHGALAVEYARRRPDSVSHVILAGTPPRGDMGWLMAESQAHFEREASDARKQRLQQNLASLPQEHGPLDAVVAQTPMRFFDTSFDAAPLMALADARTDVMQHLLGPLTSAWDVTQGAESLRVPMLIAHGRHDYVVPWPLWETPLSALPTAQLQLFDESGHQTFYEEPHRFASALETFMGVAE